MVLFAIKKNLVRAIMIAKAGVLIIESGKNALGGKMMSDGEQVEMLL